MNARIPSFFSSSVPTLVAMSCVAVAPVEAMHLRGASTNAPHGAVAGRATAGSVGATFTWSVECESPADARTRAACSTGNASASAALQLACSLELAGTRCLVAILQAQPHGHAASAMRRLARRPGHVYWGTTGFASIGRADADGSHVNPLFVSPVPIAAYGMAVDDDYIYWSNRGSSVTPAYIGRVRVDGSALDPNFITLGLGHDIFDLAVDAQHIYWTDAAQPQSIGRANLDGTDVRPGFILTGALTLPFGVAVDSQHVYWTDPYQRRMGRADLNGSNPDALFLQGQAFDGLEVDSQFLYWSEYDTSTFTSSIGRAHLDGSSPDLNFISNIPFGVAAIALDDAHVYWAGTPSQAGTNPCIGRADRNGSNANPTFITGILSVYFLAVGRN